MPCYLFTVIPASVLPALLAESRGHAFVSGVTAAATGAIAGAAFVLGKRALVDIPTWLLCGATLLVISKVKKAPEPLVILAAGVVGLVLRTAMGG